MNRSAIAATILATFLPAAGFAALQDGDDAPAFEAPAALAGQEFNFTLQEAMQQGPVVVYFYPSAYTQGCNVQAHTFAEQMDQFHEAGATVIGVSLDSIDRLKEFSADPDYCAGKLAVASDESGEIARSYGVTIIDSFGGKMAVTMQDSRGKTIGHNFAERVTFIVTPDGKVATTIGGLSPAENVAAALGAVRDLAAHGDTPPQ
ncbi:MAG: redoxin domain-containing protein [Steroidobacteraceae bacterium]